MNAQIPDKINEMDNYEKRLNDYLELVGLKRLDVDGFMLYMDNDTIYMDSIPQDVFLIPFPADSYNHDKTMEDNFIDAISQPEATAFEEVFMSMRWTMSTLLKELNTCTRLLVDSDFPPVFNGGKLRVVYGRIMYAVEKSAFIARPIVPSIKIKHGGTEYSIRIDTYDFGYPQLFKALK
ncbi:MAG: hypothetical protein O9338_21370 [Microcystis sp. LE19-251.1A]|jgi:hypothetical protein|nr:hypothetical protein [Cytophagales bacterium]MCZ8365201.1 hypothetical protein [Microcystis sp. LE19-251.1A]